jgi:branched-chain amino acid transport system ATP-binding protein
VVEAYSAAVPRQWGRHIPSEALLDVCDLRAGYGETEVLRGVDLTIAPGEIVAVLGSNGVGKSTLNRALSGIVRARAGAIKFEGHDVAHEKPQAIVARGMIHVPEGRRVFPNLTVRENLDLGSYRRGAPHRVQNRDRVFAIFPRLRERSTQRAGTLSGGEQQMLAIGRGLMAEPKLMIMDEPSLGLSPILVEELFALIERINADGVSILLVEQNVVQSLELADRAYILAEGKFVMSGSPKDIGANPELKRAYLGM